jgi:antirestriction protein
MTETRIYAACLASYNNGRLHGVWIDCAGKDAEDLGAEITAMLRASPYPNVTVTDPETGAQVPSAEEFAIHDHEGFADLIGEYTSLEDVAAIAEALDDNTKRIGLIWLMQDRGAKLADALDECDDVSWSEQDPADYAEELAADCYSAKELGPLAAYIDFERFARDMLLGGDIAQAEIDGERVLITNANAF